MEGESELQRRSRSPGTLYRLTRPWPAPPQTDHVVEEKCDKSKAEMMGPTPLQTHSVSPIFNSESLWLGTMTAQGPPEFRDSGCGQGWCQGDRVVERGDVPEGEHEVMRKRLPSLGQRGHRPYLLWKFPGRLRSPAFPSFERPPTSLGWWPRPPPQSQPRCCPASSACSCHIVVRLTAAGAGSSLSRTPWSTWRI